MLLLSTLMLSACATHINEPEQTLDLPDTEYEVRRDVPFSPEDWPEVLYADLYLPTATGHSPAVLMVHGGGWERRSRDDMTWVAEALASQGFAVMNIDYRFAPDHTFPAQLHDLQVAMTWLREHAKALSVDTDAIGGLGFSSGAHLVSLMAVVASSGHELNEPHGGPETALAAVVAGGLPADLEAFDSGPLIRQFLGGTQKEKPETYQDASPIAHVTPQTPPFFLFHGGVDNLVPLEQAKRFRARLADHEIPNQLYIMHLRGHITSFLTSGKAIDKGAVFLGQHLQ
ncbi:MAG: alpha/beta hydrolase [Oleiphilaceae bacterium]|nr:alpha/beta hydrolase [Oleiphilaceae bacterium]